jgi:hypothetical protein
MIEIFQTEDPKKEVKAYLYNLKDGKGKRLVYPLNLEPSHIIQFFDPVPPFNPFALL